MGVKKQKRTRRVLRFYKTCYGFREPYKVLCDGNFVHLVLRARMGSLHDSVPALLGASAKVFITRCILTELKKLGEDFAGTVIAARRLNIAKCDHDPVHSASNCLEEMIGAANMEHFFVATQDSELRQKLRKVTGTALIFLHTSGLILEPPSSFQVAHTRRQEAVLGSIEYRLENGSQKTKQRQLSATDQPDHESGINSNDGDRHTLNAVALDEVERSGGPSASSDTPRPKRKRAKGPNPLSCKRKKVDGGKHEKDSIHPDSDSKDKGSRQRQRRRKKKVKSSASQEAQ